jgi:flagellar motor switch protein FliN/FliY
MEPNRESIQNWFFSQLAERLAGVFEAMTGARPDIQSAPASAVPVPPPGGEGLCLHRTFHGAPGGVWIWAAPAAWTEAGIQILSAAGLESPDEPTLKSTYLEAWGQAFSEIARDFSNRVGHEITCAAGEETSAPNQARASNPAVTSNQAGGPAQWGRLTIQFPGEPAAVAEITAGIDHALADALLNEPAMTKAAASAGEHAAGETAAGGVGGLSPGAASKNFDLLLDVELPVSVSFGRAQIPLKDVIKLTTGAIVELNRSISEPVEVIVNNCVIARGEVVVVEGNFGVRIREVVSRQDRLRSVS